MTRPGVDDMTIEVVTDDSELEVLRDSWDELHKGARGTVFQTFEWNVAWWAQYGDRYTLCVVVVRGPEGDLAGILPLFREKISLGPLRLVRLRMLGARHTYGEYSPLLHPAHKVEAVGALASWISHEIKSRRCDLVELFRLPIGDTSVGTLFADLQAQKVGARLDHESIPRVIMDLPRSWEEYLGALSRSERSILKRRERSLKNAGIHLEVVQKTNGQEEVFDDFARLHRSSWVVRGHRGYFESIDGFRDFHRRLSGDLMQKGVARFYFLKNGERRIAGVYAFFNHDVCCFYLSGLDRTIDLKKYSPGKVLLSRVIRDAIAEGMQTFDFQGGDEPYKIRLGGQISWFSKIVAWGGGIRAPRVRIFLSLQSLRNFVMLVVVRERVAPFLRRSFARIKRALHHP
jgi:CelD/BcsL family acetyltransferase involved in cellulose biosynthesis